MLRSRGFDVCREKHRGLPGLQEVFLNWRDGGVIVVPGLHDKDEILGTDGLRRAEALGRAIG